MHSKWFILPLLLPTPTVWFSFYRKRRSHKRNRAKMETFWFFRLRLSCSCHSAYDSDSSFVASENQPLTGLLLTLRDVPTFSAVVVIKKLVWLLSQRKTTSLQVVETSVTVTNSAIQDYNHSDDRKLWSHGGNVARIVTFPTWKKCLRLSTAGNEKVFICLVVGFCLFSFVCSCCRCLLFYDSDLRMFWTVFSSRKRIRSLNLIKELV